VPGRAQDLDFSFLLRGFGCAGPIARRWRPCTWAGRSESPFFFSNERNRGKWVAGRLVARGAKGGFLAALRDFWICRVFFSEGALALEGMHNFGVYGHYVAHGDKAPFAS